MFSGQSVLDFLGVSPTFRQRVDELSSDPTIAAIRSESPAAYSLINGFLSPFEKLLGSESGPGSGSGSGSGSGAGNPYALSYQSAPAIDYYAAGLAQRYGMSRETAYQEALANTAYQRAVIDMQAAGLNPASLFSAGRASAASSFHGSSASGGYSSGKGAADNDQLPGWLYYGAQAAAYALGGPKASITAGLVMKALNGL